MSSTRRWLRPSFLILTSPVLLQLHPAAVAGEVQVTWGQSATATGYKLYRGTAPGTYSSSSDVGNSLGASATGLTDCQTWYFAATAYNSAGESGFSGEVSSWPRPVLSSSNPAVVELGKQAVLAIAGTNFKVGDTFQFTNPGVQITAATVASCNQLSLTVSVAANAPTGPTNLIVTHTSGVAGTGVGLVIISPQTPPTVLATSPLDGAANVSLDVQPTVQFSEAVGGVTSSTVRLLNAQGAAVAQAPGSPISGSGGTLVQIVPAAPLLAGAKYKLHVLGGSSGVKDNDGNPMAQDFLQPNGFTTVSDTTGPAVSGLAATSVGGTTATIVWTTDEPADSQVLYRKTGGQNYQTVKSSGLVTSHSVTLSGLQPGTGYQYHVKSTDGSGNSTTTSPDKTFTTSPSPFQFLRFEAESGQLVPPIAVVGGSAVFGGAWIDTPPGSADGTSSNPLGQATFGVLLPEAATWHLWLRMYGDDGSSNSWFASADGGAKTTVAVTTFGAWTWVHAQAYSLAAGLHSFELGGREPKTRADRLLVTNDPGFVPSEQPDADILPPSPVTALSATPGSGQIQLNWKNPSNSDFARTVIRYRTDGQHPTSPVDGFPVVDKTGAPGSNGSHAHTGVSAGIEYRYSAFAVDGADNASKPAHAVGLIAGAPPAPQNVVVQ